MRIRLPGFSIWPEEVIDLRLEEHQSVLGYHLILVEEHSVVPLEIVRTDAENAMRSESAQKAFAMLKKRATVVYDKAYSPQ